MMAGPEDAEVTVEATARGFFVALRERGERFSVPAGMVGGWMRRVDDQSTDAGGTIAQPSAADPATVKRGPGRPRRLTSP
jgi:hypothetical protein